MSGAVVQFASPCSSSVFVVVASFVLNIISSLCNTENKKKQQQQKKKKNHINQEDHRNTQFPNALKRFGNI
ncbi:uncharacterized protein Dyak_GE28158 [Drosophila yakuba]|uniref:Uncharacterized protein n=1 Tax=Drosophila yakuba TaxID=7245 RepID=A0A0R1EAV0_DROYA|nr:uncharacterized protein Dyak_GE28158 [Drosophila yakuba]